MKRIFEICPLGKSLVIVFRLSAILLCTSCFAGEFEATQFVYLPGPPNNPLKGLVPYSYPEQNRFPHSMEFEYLAVSDVVIGPKEYDWRKLEQLLDDISSRGNQAIFRFYLEYPNRRDAIPQYLVDMGLKVRKWKNPNHTGGKKTVDRTPDYEDINLRRMLKDFIAELGQRYDGDPRIGFITAGLLGTWGEWHNYPNSKWFASKTVQREIYESYHSAFSKTPVLLRYPSGPDDNEYADSTKFNFGYHDDSFAWATLSDGSEENDWFFWSKMTSAGLAERWRSAPIGGEVRPELWGCWASENPCNPDGQSFADCVEATHVSWLMESGMFESEPEEPDRKRAIKLVERMGYDFHISNVNLTKQALTVTVENRGVAPFYHAGWSPKLVFKSVGSSKVIDPEWPLIGIQPGQSKQWSISEELLPESFRRGNAACYIQIPNRIAGGKPIRFANANCDDNGLLKLGRMKSE